jgi:hypothetical protein
LCCQVAQPEKTRIIEENQSVNLVKRDLTSEESQIEEPQKKPSSGISRNPILPEKEKNKGEERKENEETQCEKEIPKWDELTKRQARKLMGALSLQQKRNRVELSKELMIGTLKREYKNNPEKVLKAMRKELSEERTEKAAS